MLILIGTVFLAYIWRPLGNHMDSLMLCDVLK